MAIDLCIESAGWVAHFVEANVGHSFLPLRHGARMRQTADETAANPPVDIDIDTNTDTKDQPLDAAAQIRAVAADLPIEQATAVWLIDMCGCSYDVAAAALGVSRDELAAQVTEARRTIRNTLATPVH